MGGCRSSTWGELAGWAHEGQMSPIVLDLDGDGAEFVSLDDSSAFYNASWRRFFAQCWAGRV